MKCFLHSKNEKKIKRTAKTIAAIVVIIFIIIAAFWVSTVYVRDYKRIETATSVSPDSRGDMWEETRPGTVEDLEGTTITGGGLEGDPESDRGRDVNVRGENENSSELDELSQPYAKYIEVLNQILTEHTDPNGRVYNVVQNSGRFENNCFAILDIDRDGSQELIFNFNTSNMAGMYEVVYACDEERDTIREEYSGWVDTAYYSNGLIRVSDSHNHGKDPEERGIWPYTLYRYDEVSDCYQLQYDVGSWDGQIYDEDFPKELDLDGDGILYCITEEGEQAESVQREFFDREGYEKWVAETMPEWERIDVAYHSMAEEEIEGIRKAYEQAAVYAAHADVWMAEEADEPFVTMYLLYDMDRDGSLELLANTVRGTGRFSENHFYGLTDDGGFVELPLVRLCGGKEKEWLSNFDIYSWNYDMAYQDEEGILYYEGNDFERDGMYGGYDETGFYYLKEGIVYQDSIRTCSRFTDETREKEDNHYYNIKDSENEITEGEYEAIRSRYIEDMEEYRIHQEWVEFTDMELTGGEISAEQISCGLLTSYLGSR